VADDVQHLLDFRIVGTDVAFEEGVVVLELAQGGSIFMAHDKGIRRQRAVPHVGRPSVLLPESLEASRIIDVNQ
jgi:hypothetical protein